MKNEPKIIHLNQEFVRQKLRQKKYDDVCLTGWGHLDEFVHFIINFGIFTMLAQLGLIAGHSGIPVFLLTMLAFAKPLFGLRFDDNLQYLFQDHHVLRLLGFNIKQIKEGCSKRTTEDGFKPLHPDTVRNFLKSIGYKVTVGLHLKVTRKLYKLGLIYGGLFVIDTKTVFKDSPSYEFAKKVYDYKGKHINRRGYKITIIQHVKSKLIVAVIITPANVPDCKLLLLAVRQAITILGAGVIKTLIFDKGFWDGKTLTKLKKKYGIDFMVPVKSSFIVSRNLIKIAQKDGFTKIKPGLEIKQFENVENAPHYDGKLQAIVVKDEKAKKKRKKNQPIHVYLTSLPWKDASAIYHVYRQRWVIENNAIKELCQYWILEDFHCTKFNAVRAHIIFSIVLFNLHILFKSKYGKRFTEKTIAAKRAPGFQKLYVIAYSEDSFGIFDIKEYTELITVNPGSKPP
jgi:predicted transposase YbfD/YdcC